MKKFLLSLTLLAALVGVSFNAKAQPCDLSLSGLTLSINSINKDANGNCVSINGTISFSIAENNGNKAIYIALWNEADYAEGAGAYNWKSNNSKAPKLADIDGAGNISNRAPVGLIGIDNNSASPVFLNTYSPDPNEITIANGKLLKGGTISTSIQQARRTFILNNVVIPVTGCNFSLKGNIWSTNAGSSQPSLHCYDDLFDLSVGNVTVNEASVFNCGGVPRQFQLFLDATGTFDVSYQVFIDDNNDGTINQGEPIAFTSSTFTVSNVNESAPDYNSGFQKISEPYASQTEIFRKNLLVRVTYTNPSINSTIILTPYTLNNGCALLPVTFKSFNANRSNSNQVVLEWVTSMEANNRGFHVQRNDDGNWKNVGFVFSQANGGNSTSELKYAFKDANNSKGISQYRVLQVDLDGKGKYSEVRSVRGEQTSARLTVFPNPSSTGAFNILFEDGNSVRDVVVTDVSGRSVKQIRNATAASLTVEGLTDGFYTVQVSNRTTGIITTEKVIIKKR